MTMLKLDYERDDRTVLNIDDFKSEIIDWNRFGTATVCSNYEDIPVFINEFWTSKQRAAHSLHEISYRACFKPQLPRFFITRLTKKNDSVFDPFMGRGTTLLEAALLGRHAVGNDVNPLSRMLVDARLSPPTLLEIQKRLNQIDLTKRSEYRRDLEVFFHPNTLAEICSLKSYFIDKNYKGQLDNIDLWIRMVALNRLTGHSKGFFSVYTLPPNQAASIESQKKINIKRKQSPDYRDTKLLILKKSQALLKQALPNEIAHTNPQFLNCDLNTDRLEVNKPVQLSVTSPPFLNIVNYKKDNWLRCWFVGIDPEAIQITQTTKLDRWKELMHRTLVSVSHITVPGGYFAFEVGEIQKGALRLEETVVKAAEDTGWKPEFILINQQSFTKTSNTWGVNNNHKGTNTNRIVLFKMKD